MSIVSHAQWAGLLAVLERQSGQCLCSDDDDGSLEPYATAGKMQWRFVHAEDAEIGPRPDRTWHDLTRSDRQSTRAATRHCGVLNAIVCDVPESTALCRQLTVLVFRC